MTLRNFIAKYAPPTENNTSAYLQYLVGKLGISADDTVGVLYASNSGDSNSVVADNEGDATTTTDGLETLLPLIAGIGIIGLMFKN